MSTAPNSQGTFGSDALAEIAALRATVETLMAERVTPAIDAATERAEAAVKCTTDEIRHQASRVSDAVREQPFMALGLAAAFGFVVAALMRR